MKDYTCDVKVFLSKCGPTLSKSDVRNYLDPLTNNRRRKVLCALKQFYRFIERPEVVGGFKIPRCKTRIVQVPSRQELTKFYNGLPDLQQKAFFMMLATSGLRLSELLNIDLKNVDFEKRMLVPDYHEGATKHDYVTFYNREAEQLLKQHVNETGVKSGRLFSINRRTLQGIWNKTAHRTDTRVSPQILREWFCSEMLRKGTQEIYIDCFCGRIAKSILARSYTDYSPDRLKEIYEKAGLRVLS